MTLADKLAEAHERLDALRRRVEKAEQQRDALRAEVQRVTGQFAECFKERDELAAALHIARLYVANLADAAWEEDQAQGKTEPDGVTVGMRADLATVEAALG
jgi:predicted  nucleic acid-binding Zn-ribbon protein